MVPKQNTRNIYHKRMKDGVFNLQVRDPIAEPATKQTNMKEITLTEVPKKRARSSIVGPFMASTIPCNLFSSEHLTLERIFEHTNRAYVDEYDVPGSHYPLPIVSSCILILAHLDNGWPLPLT